MKVLLYIFIPLLAFSSCKKEDSLEELGLENVHENSANQYITVVNVTEVNCSVVAFELQINENKIPSTVSYTHVLIINPENEAVKTQKTKDIYVAASCLAPTSFELVLYNESNGQKSYPTFYTYTP